MDINSVDLKRLIGKWKEIHNSSVEDKCKTSQAFRYMRLGHNSALESIIQMIDNLEQKELEDIFKEIEKTNGK